MKKRIFGKVCLVCKEFVPATYKIKRGNSCKQPGFQRCKKCIPEYQGVTGEGEKEK